MTVFFPQRFLNLYKNYQDIVKKTSPINPGEPLFVIYERNPNLAIWTARIGGLIIMTIFLYLIYLYITGQIIET